MRRKPYTAIGIARVPCAKCGKPARSQWSACSLDNFWIPVCKPCDIELNETAVRFIYGRRKNRELENYRARSLP